MKWKQSNKRATRALEMTVADACDEVLRATIGMGDEVYDILRGKGGLEKIFNAARDSVAETDRHGVNEKTFDTAMEAAINAMYDSDVDDAYEHMHKIIMTMPEMIARVAARKAAHDVHAETHGKYSLAVKRTPDKLLSVATEAVQSRLERDGAAETMNSAARAASESADAAAANTAMVLMMGAPCHAATSAVFGASVRGISKGLSTSYIIQMACLELPDLARKHGELIVNLVAEISEAISENVRRRRKYENIVREAERLSSTSAVEQMASVVVENTIDTIYSALIAGAYLMSNKKFFEAGYEDALAEVCEVSPKMRDQIDAQGETVVEGDIPVPEEVIEKMRANLTFMLMRATYTEEEMERFKTFESLRSVDYKDVAASDMMQDLATLYRTAYEEAHAAIS